MKTRALITITIGDKYRQMAEITHPTLKAYADRIGADFHVISDRKLDASIPIGYEKLRLKDYLQDYEEILFMDTDLIVREDTPNLFHVVPEGMFGAFNEGEWIPERIEALKAAQKLFGFSAPKFEGKYYNTGVMVIRRNHIDMFEHPEIYHDHFYEQTYFNLMLARNKIEIRNLPHAYNRMCHFEATKSSKDSRLESYVVHYAGLQANLGFEGVLNGMREDLKMWQKMKEFNYHIPKLIKVSVGGGLGDQIAAEPVVRELRRLYPYDRVVVASHWPEIFEALEYPVESVDIRKHDLKEEPYAVFHTYSSPDTDAWKYMTHVLMNSTDFSSLLAIRRQLPPEKKTIKIGFTAQDLVNMYAKIGVMPGDLDDAICIHPGRSWRTKTLPVSFWNEVIQGCVDAGYKVVVFGKDGKDLQGLTKVTLPEGVIDAREKLTIRESLVLIAHSFALFSNDSAPIHMAGATDTWILGVYTAKHPAFVIPFRHGTQSYKTREINRRPSCFPCNVDAVTTSLDEVRADYCTNYEQTYACFPTSAEALEVIHEVYQTRLAATV